jgi:adenosylcobinamide-phosphate synthase
MPSAFHTTMFGGSSRSRPVERWQDRGVGGRGGVARAAGIVVGFAADRAFGDPRRYHPVAGFGRSAAALEKRMYADNRAAGAAYTIVLVGATTVAAATVQRSTRGRPVAEAAVTALATWAVLGGRSLEREAATMAELLADRDLPAARRRLGHLCSRDATDLDAGELARATVESVAENTSDACVAPLLWGGVAGLPGLLGYRAINTLDAMVGYRTKRHGNFGWASARLDDLANLVPARVCAVLAGLAGRRPRRAWQAWRNDAGKHPSPNAGPVEASFAGALGLTLGGANAYGDEVEDRGTLGDGPRPRPADIGRVTDLSRRVGLAAATLAVALSLRPRAKRRG